MLKEQIFKTKRIGGNFTLNPEEIQIYCDLYLCHKEKVTGLTEENKLTLSAFLLYLRFHSINNHVLFSSTVCVAK